MTCLAFVMLKACAVWSTRYDFVIAFGLLALDLIVVAEWYRIVLHKRGR